MEHKTRKMLALGAVVMLCAVALIGAGYAVFAGNAKTYNSGNSANVGYMTITPGGAEANWNAITYGNTASTFNEYTYVDTDTYYAYSFIAAPTDKTVSDVVYKAVSIGTKDFNVSNQTGANISTLSVLVYANKGVGNADYLYILEVEDQRVLLNTSAAAKYDFAITKSIDDGDDDNITVKLYIATQYNVHLPTPVTVGGEDFMSGKAVNDTTYNGYDAEQKAKYSSSLNAHASTTDEIVGFSGLDLSFIVKDTTSA